MICSGAEIISAGDMSDPAGDAAGDPTSGPGTAQSRREEI
jgi:hypothetical protein